MNYIKYIIAISLVIVVSTATVFVFNSGDNNYDSSTIKITKYKIGGRNEKLKEIYITDKLDIDIFNKYVNQIKPLSAYESVDLVIVEEVVIENKNNKIIIQLRQKDYCDYYDKSKKVGYMSKMPYGLIEWLKEKLEEN